MDWKHGRGVHEAADESSYEGEFCNSERHGRGVITVKLGEDGTVIYLNDRFENHKPRDVAIGHAVFFQARETGGWGTRLVGDRTGGGAAIEHARLKPARRDIWLIRHHRAHVCGA